MNNIRRDGDLLGCKIKTTLKQQTEKKRKKHSKRAVSIESECLQWINTYITDIREDTMVLLYKSFRNDNLADMSER